MDVLQGTYHMTTYKSFSASILGLICTVFGIWLRLQSRNLAWPATWDYSGPRQDTIWAIREQAYQDASLAILGFGLLAILLVLANWLWASPANHQER